MLPEEQAEMERLCRLIQDEKDHAQFTKLVSELNALFERKDRRLNVNSSPSERQPPAFDEQPGTTNPSPGGRRGTVKSSR